MFKQDLLKELLEDMGIVEDQVSGPLFRFREMILDWNDKINLTAITGEEEMYLKHFIDSYLIMKTGINLSKKRILDLGTGSGFPGIPLALYWKNSEFTLVDSLAKRITFLEAGQRILPSSRNTERTLTWWCHEPSPSCRCCWNMPCPL